MFLLISSELGRHTEQDQGRLAGIMVYSWFRCVCVVALSKNTQTIVAFRTLAVVTSCRKQAVQYNTRLSIVYVSYSVRACVRSEEHTSELQSR